MCVRRSSRTLAIHISICAAALVAAWALRFEFSFPDREVLLCCLPILILFRIAAFERARLLHSYWQYAGISDAIELSRAVLIGTIGFVVAVRYVLGIERFPLSVYVLEAILTALLAGGLRIAARIHASRSSTPVASCRRVFIVGAGFAAQLLIRELRHATSNYVVVGCVDDDDNKLGLKVHGVPVLGRTADLPQLLISHPVHEILIAIPSASSAEMRKIVSICEHTKTEFKTIPSLREIVQGKATVRQLRQVNLEDLLGRDPVQLDERAVREALLGRSVLVTGAAGSIGSELCRQIVQYRPSRLVCLDHDETALFHLQSALAKAQIQVPIIYAVCDYGDLRVARILRENDVDIIFHAAAYKHVPLMETNAISALRNNVFGLLEFIETAETCGCSSFLLISSDKAVAPSSLMGATKRIGELILASRPNGPMRCMAVRFGNVLGSRGSLVPLLQQQIANESRIFITHPDVTRYFMTIPEAVSLVLQALTVGDSRDILVLDMGERVRILDLARHLVRLTGRGEHEVKIVFTGLRKGEKLHEELFYPHEEPVPTATPKVLRTRSIPQNWAWLSRTLIELRTLAESSCDAAIRSKVRQIVPEYSYMTERNFAPLAALHDAAHRPMLTGAD